MIDFTRFNSLIQIMEYFTSSEVCCRAIVESRWGKGKEQDVICPYCGHRHCTMGTGGRYMCPGCHNKFSCLVGTIFENTKVSLVKWFMAMYLISSNKKGVSSCQLSRDIRVTQKTAWYMLQKIRTLFYQEGKELHGHIELDEVYLGGREYFKHKSKRQSGTQGRSTKTKTPVFGMMQRSDGSQSYVSTFIVPRTDRGTLLPIVTQFCKQCSDLYTDELSAYTPLGSMGYSHHIVNHGVSQYVDGLSYTNTIEGYWGHLKRMITGTYHKVTPKYLQRYLDESAFRWNYRKEAGSDRFKMMFERALYTLPYSLVRL